MRKRPQGNLLRVDQENTSRLTTDRNGFKQMKWNKRNYTEGKKDLWNDMAGSISNERNKRQNIN
jgi:hypothetical protein